MNREIIATRYARALFDLAVEKGRVEEVGDALDRIAPLAVADRLMAEFWESPMVERERKKAALEQIIRKSGVSGLSENALRLLVERDRLHLLKYIAHVFRRYADAHLNRASVRVTTAKPLAPQKLENISRMLRQKTGKTIYLENVQDASIVGGMVIRVGNTVFDKSIRGRLEMFRRELVS
jgi:F-type H+-transporting ATPase subunit delta